MTRRARRIALAGTVLAGTVVTALALQAATNSSVTVSIDVLAARHPISPLVYGVSYGTASQLWDLRTPLVRMGGNNTSRYNWQQNADNRARDWYYESIPAESGSSTPGEVGDSFIGNAKAAGARPMLTFPMLGWVAKLGPNRSKLASFSIAKYGSQTDADWSWFPDAGNGVSSSGAFVTGNDPNDANVANGTALQQQWAQHLVQRWGYASGGGLGYYILDNEHSIWQETHRDVQPTGARMDEVRDLMIGYAAALKAVDGGAQIVGPEEWGWSGFKLSGYDQQYGKNHGWGTLPDQAAHGGVWYLPYLLDQLRQASAQRGVRLLDVLTVHWYPQGGEYGDDVSQAMQLLRNRSTRALWDPNYLDPTWINDYVQLVPRLRSWVNSYYPGTRIGLTEYSWGADGHINGATTQADVLGIFGREGLDLGARWVIPDPSTPTYKAMKLYRNYDGAGGAFGDTSVQAAVPNPDELSAFAALRGGDGALTVVIVNKVLSGSTAVSLSLGHFAAGSPASVWQLTAANSISRLGDVGVSGNTVSLTVPQQSVTMVVIPNPRSDGTDARFRLYSPVTREHHYTTDANEYAVLGSRGWAQEGVAHRLYPGAATVAGVGTVPLYRLYHRSIRQHFWTADVNEANVLAARGWAREGVDGYLLPRAVSGVTVPLYRLAHRTLPLHLWTTDANEYAVLAGCGWRQEGVAGHVVP